MTRQMKNSGISYFGEIPTTWQVVRNGFLFRNTKTIVLPNKEYQLLSLTTKGVRKKDINDTSGKVPENYNGYQIVHPKDMVMCLFDIDCSAVFSGLSNYYGMISPAYKILKCHSEIMPEYAQYVFSYIGGKRLYKQYSKNLRYTLNIDDFMALKLVLPPLAEQKTIADFLDTKCAEIDRLLADLDAEVKTLTEYKKSIIAEIVTHGLNPNAPMKQLGLGWIDEVPAHWAISRIASLYTVRNEKVSDKDYMPLSVTMKGIVPQLDNAAKTKHGDDRKLIRKGDFVINSRSDRRGSCGISPYEGSCSLINTVLAPREKMNPLYYDWLFHTSIFADEFYKWGYGIVDDLWTTNWGAMRRIQIPVPPIEEQEGIAHFLNSKVPQVESTIADKLQQIETLKAYKSSLIYEYVTGKKQVI